MPLTALATALGVCCVLAVAAGARRQQIRTMRRLASLAEVLRPQDEPWPLATRREGHGDAPAAAPAASVAAGFHDDVPAASVEGGFAEAERLARAGAAQRSRARVTIARLTDALSSVPQGVVLCGPDGIVWFRNEPARSFAGARHGNAIIEVAVGELLRAALQAPAPQRPQRVVERQVELYGPPRRTLQLRARPLDNGALGAVAIIEDVSQRQHLEAVRRDFIANVSHELKTPVGALGILAEALSIEDDPSVMRRLAGRMHTEAFRVARIIDDLLDLSRIESEESPARQDVVALDELVAEAVDGVRSVADHRGISLRVTNVSPCPAVVGDRGQLGSALRNLLDNAVKYSDPGGSVDIVVDRVADLRRGGASSVEISVRDHGIGIPAADLGRVFERFYRVDRARARETGGTGLGLAIVHHVATNHGGAVRVSSREGEGSTFTLSLPALVGTALPDAVA